MDREGFRSHAAQLGLGSKLLPSIWLAVLMQGVNRGKKELDIIRVVSDEQGGLELTSPMAYSMPYISPEKIEVDCCRLNRGTALRFRVTSNSLARQ